MKSENVQNVPFKVMLEKAYELYAQACLDADVARKKADRLWDEYRRLLADAPLPAAVVRPPCV